MRARRSGRGPRSRRARFAALGLFLFAVFAVWGLVVAVSVARAQVHTDSAVDAMKQVRNAGLGTDPADLRDELDDAASSFRAARQRLSNPAVGAARRLPFVGRQLDSADAMAAAGAAVARVGDDALRALGDRFKRTPSAGERVQLLADVARVTGDADRRLGTLDLGPRSWLVPPLAAARRDFGVELARTRRALSRAHAGSRSARDLLAGPRRYLVFAANNAEMRAGSGMFLSVGVLESSGGRLTLGQMRSVTDIPVADGVTLTGDLADRWGWLAPHTDWRNLMLSPRFDVNAELAARMWEASGGGPVDGVLSVDPVALAAVVRATGEVRVHDRAITGDNVIAELLHEQYVRHAGDADKGARREELGLLARAAMAAIDTRPWSVEGLGHQLAEAARGRHVLLWARRVDEQRGWEAAGLDGGVPGDALLVALHNRAGNKLDQFVQIDVAASSKERDDGGRDVVLRVDVVNDTPPNEPPYIAGPYPGSPFVAGEYFGLLSVSVPRSARNTRIDEVPKLAVAGADGPVRVVAGEVRVLAGERKQFRVRFELPPRPAGEQTSVTVIPSARVPAVRWRHGRTEWQDDSRRIIRW